MEPRSSVDRDAALPGGSRRFPRKSGEKDERDTGRCALATGLTAGGESRVLVVLAGRAIAGLSEVTAAP